MISWGLINSENAFVTNFIYPPEILMRLCKVSLSNIVSISETSEDESALCINHSSCISLLLPRRFPPRPPAPTLQHADNSGSGTWFHRLTLLFFNLTQMHRGLITVCTLKYTNVCARSFVNQLLFNYNFTWTLLISGANRVSPFSA